MYNTQPVRMGKAGSGNFHSSKFTIQNSHGIALVVTLLMLSVITFLAVAFLVLTRGHQAAVATTEDQNISRAMAEAATARAESEIVARMMAVTDLLSFDYSASHNYASPKGFVPGLADFNNVNYETNSSGAPMSSTANGGADWAQNIGNLIFDPRVPVFIQTSPGVTDFRFWIDLNRNGRFETNGNLPALDVNGLPIPVMDANNNPHGFLTNYFDGEPEWIGVLKYPEFVHSATNNFIGRYAYVVLPVGKMLDWNYIHNYSKSLLAPAKFPTVNMPAPVPAFGQDGYSRDEGVGSWELNLAGLLWGVNPNIYANALLPAASQYSYLPGYLPAVNANTGLAFDDAYAFVRFRYAPNYNLFYPGSVANFFGLNSPIVTNGIDEYGLAPNYTNDTGPWPGGYATNMMYDIEDVFDPNKNSQFFTNRLMSAGTNLDSLDRYTFQRLLTSIGAGSIPELQTYVYDDGVTFVTNGQHTPPTRLRNKININYDNTFQIVNGQNTSPSPLTLTNWPNALAFFTNAAESLVRSQEYPISNYINFGSNLVFQPGVTLCNHFGLTNIPVWSSTNPTIRYSENLHRMLQLAANIYEATSPTNIGNIQIPHVFRPRFFANAFGGSSQSLYIIGYTNVTAADAANQLTKPFRAPNYPFIGPDDNVVGIPWVVGAVKGLPEFNSYSYETSWMVTRKLLFVPTNGVLYTNQFYIMSVSNVFGMDAWNAYNRIFPRPVTVIASNYVSIVLTNNYGFGTNIGYVSSLPATTINGWPAWNGQGKGFEAFLVTNTLSLPDSYFSESSQRFFQAFVDTNTIPQFGYTTGSFRAGDLTQKGWPVHNWTLSVTNTLVYVLLDTASQQVLDFVNLGPFGTSMTLSNEASASAHISTLANSASGPPQYGQFWDMTGANDTPTSPMSIGVLNQIRSAMGTDVVFSAELTQKAGTNTADFSVGNNPNLVNRSPELWQINDPLVHYTIGDLTWPGHTGVLNAPLASSDATTPLITTVGKYPTPYDRFEPWPSRLGFSQTVGPNMTFKDPLITQPNDWSFPANKFPSVGWLGRVHRGTPWQTLFLKADQSVVNGPYTWTNSWVNTFETYPTNDYGLIDLFTATPNDNAARGLLSVNQTNAAPWYAVFSGVSVPTNNIPISPTNFPLTIEPSTISFLLNDLPATPTWYDPNDTNNIILGINTVRALETNGLFHRMGDILKAQTLTIASPYLPLAATNYTDEVVEAIPQQVLGLLKLGQPQFVIYGYGQSLKPKDLYFGNDANFNVCTNYQITGEFLTRMVCHVVGDPRAVNPKIQVDSFNIVSGN